MSQRRCQEAIELYRAAAQQSPPDHGSLFNEASCLDALHRRKEARVILDRILRENPDHEEAGLLLAGQYLDERRFTDAIALYTGVRRGGAAGGSSSKNNPEYPVGVTAICRTLASAICRSASGPSPRRKRGLQRPLT
ncbi:MAG: tetratricopeptide repeat protein [Thermoanaerobaculia bacterium]